MSEPPVPAAAADPQPDTTPVPAQSPASPSLLSDVKSWFRHDPAVPLVADEAKALLQGHSAAVFSLAAKLLTSDTPEAQALRADMLKLVESAAHIAGISL